MKKSTNVCVILLISLSLQVVVSSTDSYGFNDKTHELLSKRAVNPGLSGASNLDAFLKAILGFEFQQGIQQPLVSGQEGTVVGQIALGAIREDYPEGRVLNHFHDPTRNWNSAGLFGLYLSSIAWSQLQSPQPYGETRTWKTARDAYFMALTGTTPSQRRQWYAETFRTLGNLIHHVQDAAVPSHTRSDSHLAPFVRTLFPDGDAFHYWAESPPALTQINGITQALRFDPSILNQSSGNPLAPVPVARIIDKTDSDFGVLSSNLNIGLAEYSNANFFSKDTIISSSYQYPRLSQLQIGPLETAFDGRPRRYLYFKPGFGDGPTYRLSTYGAMYNYVNINVPTDVVDLQIDDKVHADYGAKLFPRAIGYSAGLIDFFFRGSITGGILFGENGPIAQRPNSIALVDLAVSDVLGNEPVGPGTIQVILMKSAVFSSGSAPPVTETFPDIIVSEPVTISGSPIPLTLRVPFSSLPFPTADVLPDNCICNQSTRFKAYVVFKGTLGQEIDKAVAVGGHCFAPYLWQVEFSHLNTGHGDGPQFGIAGIC